MKAYLLPAIKNYYLHYSDLSKSIWKGIAISFIESTFGGVCFFLSLYFVNELNYNVAIAGTIISCYGLGTILGGITSGKLSDYISSYLILTLSLLLQGVAFLFLIYVKSKYFLMLNLFILGFSTYGVITSNNIWMLKQSLEEKLKLKSTNLLYTASNLGIGLAAFIVSMFSHSGFKNIFLISGCALLLAGMYFLFRFNSKLSTARFHDEEASFVEQIEPADKNKKITWLVLTCLFFVGLIIVQRSTTYTIFLNQMFPRLGIKGVGFLYALNPFLIVIFQTPLGNILGNYNKLLLVGIGAFLMGFGMFLLSVSVLFLVAIVACIIYTLGEMMFFTMAQLVCYQKSAKKKKGYTIGVFRMVYATSIVIGPTIGGFIYHYAGANTLWYLSGIIGAFALIACNYYKKYY